MILGPASVRGRSILRRCFVLLAALAALASGAPSDLVQAQAAGQAPTAAQPPAPQRGGGRAQQPQGPRLQVLMVSGGPFHDYPLQAKVVIDLMSRVLPIDWTVVVQGGGGTNAKIPLYQRADWAKGFDLVVHNECYADVNDEAFVKRITDAHRAGIPAMVIHCSMHSYRALATDPWREFLGVTTRSHTRSHNVAVKFTARDHSIVAAPKSAASAAGTPAAASGLASQPLPETWSTPTDELYVIDKFWPGATALATAISPEDQKEYPLVWVHEYGGARVFGTTLGHGNETWMDPVFQELLKRGFKWAVKRE